MWTPQFIGIAFGAVLIVVAILGGGIEIKELKIPPLSIAARCGAAAFGAAVMFASFWVTLSGPVAHDLRLGQGQAGSAEARVLPANPAPRPILFTDTLGPGQQWERLRIFIDGRHRGDFSIDTNSPRASFEIPGETRQASYQISGTEAREGRPGVRRIDGAGTIDLSPGAVFGVGGGPQPDVAVKKVTLELN